MGKRLTLTAGSKIQEGTLAGIQLQPSARVLYAPGPGVSVWAAISRAVVAPSLQDTRYSIPVSLGNYQGLPLTGELTGNPGYLPENVIAYETGARTRLGRTVALDTASFYNSNRRIQSINAMAPVPVAGAQLTPRHLEFPSNTSFSQAAYVPRSGFLKVNWSF